MTDREAMKMAIEALMDANKFEYKDEIAALRQALAQPEQEPVAYLCENAVGYKFFRKKKPDIVYKPIPLYRTPQHKPEIKLTDEDIRDVYVAWDNTDGASFADFARAIETKLKTKTHDQLL